MKEQAQNKTTPIKIKEEFDEDITIQLESIKREVLDEGEKNSEISKDKQPIIVEQQQKQPTIVGNQQQGQQKQPEIIEMKSELITDNNEPEKIDEQILSCSTNFDNPGYPGFIEAVRQAKKKKKSRDASFDIFFPHLPESVKKQHDLNLSEWWNYCSLENKDPLETDLSVVTGYLGKKLDAGTSRDDFESITSSVCLIASDKMEKQINESSFILSELAKYLSVNNTDCYKTPKSSCQNDLITSSLYIGTKKQDGSKISSVQIENVQKAKLSEVIDISDDDLDTESPTKLLTKSKDLLNNNEPTNLKKNSVFLKKAVDSSQLKTPLIKPTSTKPPAILLYPASKKKVCKNNEIKELIPSSINGQQTQVVEVLENNKENQQITIKRKSLKELLLMKITHVVVDDESDSKNEKSPTITMPVLEQQQDEVTQEQQSTLSAANNVAPSTTLSLTPSQLNTSALECSSNPLEQNIVKTSGNLQSGSLLVNAVQKKSQEQQPLANNTHTIDSPTKATVIKSPIPSENLPVHHSPSPLIPYQLNTSVLECSSEKLKQNKAETTDNLQSKLSPGNAVQQQLSSAINILSNDVVSSTCRLKSSASTSVTLKLQTSSTETLIPAIQSPTLSANLSAHHDTQPLLPCQLKTNALKCSSKALEQSKVVTGGNFQSGSSLVNAVQEEQQQQQQPSENNTPAIDSLTKTTEIESPISSENLPIHHNTQPLPLCQLNTNDLECSRKALAQNKVKTSDNLQSGLLLVNSVEKKQQQQKPLANNNQAIDPPTKTMTLAIKPSTPAKLPVHHNTSPSTPCEINSSESNYSSKGVKQNIVEKTADLQTELQLINAAPKIQQQQVESEADAIVDLTQTSDNDDDDEDASVNNDKKNNRKSLKLQSILKCRTVKIGSYKYTPKNNVIINTTGLILSVPLLENEAETVKVHVQYQDIYKVLIHYDSSKPILFFYTNTISGSKIRKLLGMNNPKGPYYDPASKNQTQKRIILFPKLLKSSSSMILKKLFSSNTFVKELDVKEANAILLKSALLKKPNNSSSKIDKRQTTIANANNIVENSTIHSAAPTKGEDINKSITKEKSAKLSCINKDTNANDKNKEKSNSGNDKLANNDIRQKTSSVVIKKTNSDKTFSNIICSTSKRKNLLSLDKNHTTGSDNNSQGSIQTKINNNNKRKHSQLEVSRPKTSPVIIKKTKLDKNQPARKNDDGVLDSIPIPHKPLPRITAKTNS